MDGNFTQTYFFYDLETSGLSARRDRILQFAGQRVSRELEPIGEPVNLLVKLGDDTLPSPKATMVTGITPQKTQSEGIPEPELCRFLQTEIFTPGTIVVGYNNIRFDDEMMRFLFWRNFYDAYEWEWQDGRGRWDLLDTVRMVRALRPDGINWPMDENGHPTNRLELLTAQNGLKHLHAHDAFSDVEATIATARLLHERQPQMFDYLFGIRTKSAVLKLVNVANPRPFVYTSGRYSGFFGKTTVAVPVAELEHGKMLVFDLRYNLDEMLEAKKAGKSSAELCVVDCTGTEISPKLREQAQELPASWLDKEYSSGAPRPRFLPVFKKLAPNRCPAVAPLAVLEKDDGWARLGLDKEQVRRNLQALRSHPDVIAEIARDCGQSPADKPASAGAQLGLLDGTVGRQEEKPQAKPAEPAVRDADALLYDGFISDADQNECAKVRQADAKQLENLAPEFRDSRLSELFLHYKARNFPESLNAEEREAWENYRRARLNSQAPQFVAELAEIEKELAENPDEDKAFLVEELKLWYQSLGE